MASIRTKFTVGLFVVIGITVAFVATIWLGMSHYFEKGQMYVAYFDESVQGLGKDSPVKYRGVTIGRVDSIGVAPDATLIQVVLKIESDLKPGMELIGQLKSVGITGIMFVELDRKGKEEPDVSPKISFPSSYPVIATKPSDIKQLMASFEKALDEIKQLDLKGISDKTRETMDAVQVSVKGIDTARLSAEFRAALGVFNQAVASVNQAAKAFTQMNTNVDQTVRRVDRILDENEEKLVAAADDFRNAMSSANRALEQGNRLISHADEEVYRLMKDMAVIMENLQRASETLNHTLDAVSRQPSRLIFSPSPAERTPAEPTEEP
jgi:phospholipid/cholesterol/gamma-HCH transport system substrate-binding protein